MYVFIYITCKDSDEAEKISNILVSEKLIACANVLAPMKSYYIWKGKKICDNEVPLIAKTKKNLVKKLIKRVKQIHSYDVPCIVSLPIQDGNPDYFKWIDGRT